MARLLTVAAVQRLRPTTQRREIRDGGAPGLYLVIQSSGHKSWAMRLSRLDGRSAKLTLGPCDLTGRDPDGEPVLGGPLSLSAARILCVNLSRQRTAGIDVASLTHQKRERVLKDPDQGTFAATAKEFIADHARPKNRGWRATAKVLGLNYPAHGEPTLVRGGLCERWAAKPIAEIDALSLYSVVEEARRHAIPGTSARRAGVSDPRGRAMAGALGKLFSWATQHHRVVTNPTVGMFRPKSSKSRHRVLEPSEVAKLWKACDDIGWPFGPCLQLLLITGARRGEVAGMRWDELSADLSTWDLPPARTKNKLPHSLTLPPMAREIVAAAPRIEGCPFVFTTNASTTISGFSKIKRRLDSMMNIAPWRVHDLRRTAVTMMAEIGILPHVIEAVVNHISGHKGGVAGTYNRAQYAAEKRAALERWAAHVENLTADRPAKVVPIKTPRRR